jgi:DNA-directed RNA polymerase subunit M/transcription elongation factor TFIIS
MMNRCRSIKRARLDRRGTDRPAEIRTTSTSHFATSVSDMEQGNPVEASVLVVCPTCGTQMHPRRELIGKRVRCPECGAAVPVVEQTPQQARATTHPPGENEYRLSGDDQPVEQPQLVKVKCGTCHALLYPRAELIGKHVRCPDCFKPVLVVAPVEAPPPKKLAPAGEYNLDAPPPENPLAALVPTTPRAEPILEPEPLPPPAPSLWYWTGIFSFPWYPETVSRWMTLTLFAVFANGVAAYGVGVIAEMAAGGNALGNIGAAIKVAFTIALAAISWLLMLAYGSGCVVAIIRDTASGNDDVADWHDTEFPEAMARALDVLFPMAGAGALGFGAYLVLLPLVGGPWASVAGGLVGLFLYPIMLVSALENGAFWVVVSGSTLRLIFGFFSGWLLVNLEMAVVTGAWLQFTRIGSHYLPIITAILGAPLYAAVLMIDARLLGRFLYRANEIVSERAAQSDEEDDDGDED